MAGGFGLGVASASAGWGGGGAGGGVGEVGFAEEGLEVVGFGGEERVEGEGGGVVVIICGSGVVVWEGKGGGWWWSGVLWVRLRLRSGWGGFARCD